MCLLSRLLCLSNVVIRRVNASPIFKNLNEKHEKRVQCKGKTEQSLCSKRNTPVHPDSCFPGAHQMPRLLNLMNLYLKATKENQKQGKPKGIDVAVL